MAQPIENLPEEAGEEIALSNDDEDASPDMEETDDSTTSPDESEDKPDEAEEAEESEEKDSETDEREFDKNPTVLYALVQKKLWKETIARAKCHPEEARSFILRREKDGRVRWRLLPLHAAIVFKAPEDVIEALLNSFPNAAKAKDDQGMLPLHLAFRNGASAEIVNMLLLAFPDSVEIPDRKGRVPLTLAKSSSSPNRDLYIEALEKGTSHYSVTALALARERIVAEQKAIFDEQLKEALKLQENAIREMGTNAEKKQTEMEETLLEKEKELVKLHENSQVLVDHVASLEAQMTTRSDTERFLATKIAKLEDKVSQGNTNLKEKEDDWEIKFAKAEEKLKEAEIKHGNEREQFGVEKAKLDATVEGLEEELEKTKNELSATQTELNEAIEKATNLQVHSDMKDIKADAKISKVELNWANAQANIAILESQLKKRMENEHLLANQVSTLAARLAESSNSNLSFSQEMKNFDEKRMVLETTVEVLKKRLANVTAVMESTREQQMKILDDAISQEETVAKCMESHAQTVSESIQQEVQMVKAKEELMALIESTFNEANEKRLSRLNTSTQHGQSLSAMNSKRANVLSCAETVTSNVIEALENDLNLETLSEEVQAAIEKRLPHGIVESIASEDEVRDEVCVETKELKVETEESVAATEMSEPIEIEVVASPKKGMKTTEEQRNDVHVERVTAE